MPTVVQIPHVSRDERIGSVFNELFRVIYETSRYDTEDDVIWDFENCSFFHPFFIAPLAIYRENCERNVCLKNICGQLAGYLNLVRFDGLLNVSDREDIREQLNGYINRSYIPICRFNMSNTNVDRVQSVLQSIIECQANLPSTLKAPLSYMIGEIVGNINEHASSEYGYIFSQYLKSERCINICIADIGITVFGSYMSRGKYLPLIGDNEASALKMANEGYSTKDRPECESRGYGISTTKKMLVEGLEGAFFMLSGRAFHRADRTGNVYLELPDTLFWNGSIILMKIPVAAPDGFDYYNYLY